MLAARLRVNTVGGEAKYGGTTGQSLISHSFGGQIPSGKYGKEHPDYFALRNGKRLSDVKDDWSEAEPCLTNPDVLKIVTEAVLADLKAHPDKENISVSQNDNAQNCLCPNCKAIDDREGTPMGTLLEFVNAIADTVAKEHPTVKVGTLSYWYTRKPPKTLKPRPNVQIQLCSIECCMIHPINDPTCEKNVQFCQDMDEWGKLTQNIFIWNYNTNFSNYLLPCPNLRVIEPNIRYFVDHGAKGIFMQAAGNSTGAELSDLRNYVMANLLWDPTRSGQQLVDEFLDLHYGQAAPPIRRFINMYHDHCESKGIHRNCFGRAADYAIDETIAAAAMDAFAEALTLAENEAVKLRVEKASICAYRAAIDPAWEVPGDKRPLEASQASSCDRWSSGCSNCAPSSRCPCSPRGRHRAGEATLARPISDWPKEKIFESRGVFPCGVSPDRESSGLDRDRGCRHAARPRRPQPVPNVSRSGTAGHRSAMASTRMLRHG